MFWQHCLEISSFSLLWWQKAKKNCNYISVYKRTYDFTQYNAPYIRQLICNFSREWCNTGTGIQVCILLPASTASASVINWTAIQWIWTVKCSILNKKVMQIHRSANHTTSHGASLEHSLLYMLATSRTNESLCSRKSHCENLEQLALCTVISTVED